MEIVAENRIGRRILRHVEALSVPRFPGTGGELKVRKYILTFFESADYPLTEQEFSSSLFPLEIFPRLGILFLMTLLIIAYVIVETIPALAVEIGFLTLIVLALATRWIVSAEWMYKFRKFGILKSKNLIAIHPSQQRRINVVFTAHYDSKSQRFSGPIRSALLGALFILIELTVLLIALVTIFDWWGEIILITLIPVLILAIMIMLNTTGNTSPGSYDNASGVAVMMEVAQSFVQEYPNANLAFIATGAEEAGLCGAVALMQDESFKEQFPPERTIIINLDGIGSKGPVRITDSYGIPPSKTGVLLSNLCQEIARRFGIEAKTSWLPFGFGMDHIPFAAHGYQSVTLSTAGWNETYRAVHTHRDTHEKLDLAALEYCYAICREIVDSIPQIHTN